MPDSHDDRIDAAIAEYLAACDTGHPPERSVFLARHPDLAASLVPFLDDHLRMKRATTPTDQNATIGFAPGLMDLMGSVNYVGDYQLIEEIARGGMGVVYKARQATLNRDVAVKMILAGGFAGATERARFRLEAEAAANLDHPNILPTYEVGEHDGRPYFSMKLVAGGSLSDKFAISPQSSSPRTAVRGLCQILSQVCRAVHFAHQHGVLHRDLKPANILLDNDGTPYVTDFGLAKRTDSDDGATRTGAILGTPGYMSPEQARGEKGLTTTTDVYSLGAILYEVLAGRPPFRGDTVYETIKQVIEAEPAVPPGDRDLAAIALKCLAKNSAARYASAADLADDLDRWLAGEPTRARPPSTARLAVRWLKANALTSLLILALGVGWGKVMTLAAFAAMGVEKTAMILPPSTPPWNPLWWFDAAGRYWPFRILILVAAFALTVGPGWFVRWVVRPRESRNVLAGSAVIGGLATFVVFVLLGGPLIALGTKLELQIHPITSREAFDLDDPAPHEMPYLIQYLPADAPPLGSREYDWTIRTIRSRMAGTNRMYTGIVVGFGVVVVFGLYFLPTAIMSGWAADYLVRSGRGFWGCALGYLELYLPFFVWIIWTIVTVCMWYVPQTANVDPSYTLRPFYLLELLGFCLLALTLVGVVRGWRWWVRIGVYGLWIGVVVIVLWLGGFL